MHEHCQTGWSKHCSRKAVPGSGTQVKRASVEIVGINPGRSQSMHELAWTDLILWSLQRYRQEGAIPYGNIMIILMNDKYPTSGSAESQLAARPWYLHCHWRCHPGTPIDAAHQSTHQTHHGCGSASLPTEEHPLQIPIEKMTSHSRDDHTHNLVAPLQCKLHGSLHSVTYMYPNMNMSRNVLVAVTVAQNRIDFYFLQQLRQKIAKHVHLRACYTRQWFEQLVMQQNCNKCCKNTCCMLLYLVVRWQFHCRDTVNVFLDFSKEVIPATDDATLVLVVHQLQFIALPYISHLQI